MDILRVLCTLGLGCIYNVLGQRTSQRECACATRQQLSYSACTESAEADSGVIRAMKSVIQTQNEQLSLLTQSLTTLQERVNNLEDLVTEQGNEIGSYDDDVTIGTHYIRWGRTSCPGTASLIYEGHSAKSHYSHTGGGSDYICLDKNPLWPDNVTAGYQSGSYIYGVEYQTLTVLPSSLTEHDAPCAVCHVSGRGEELMIPGNRTCPMNWTKEYEGILVAANSKHEKSSFVCLDANPETVPGHHESTNGGLFYTVEARCTALPCPPYVNGYEVACVVCTL